MKIEKLKIHNWRSIADEEVMVEDMIILIGQNNCGKSNIISSLLFFFGSINHSALDFHHNSSELFVEVTFRDLDDFDKNQFKKYLSPDGKICVRKSVNSEGEVAYNGYLFSPVEDFLNDSIGTKREDLLKTPLEKYIPATGRLTKELVREAQENYIADNSNIIELKYTMETSNFMGAKSIAKGMFGDIYFIPAVKNASDEFKTTGTTIFNQLFSQIILKMSVENEHYKKAKQQIQKLTQILNKNDDQGEENKERPKEIKSLEKDIEFELKKWNTTIDIEITPPNIEDVLKVNTNVWVNDGKKTDIGRKGHGLQRSMIFALIKSWAEYLKAQRIQKDLVSDQDDFVKQTRRASESTYFFFEEPELFLHPQAQKELYSSLKELSKSDYQIILCTHSSSFLDLEDYKSISIVSKKDLEIGTKVKQFTQELFDADEKTNFNLIYWLNPERSELFFATKVLLVEGPTDKTIIPRLAKQCNVHRFDYTIIECGGKDNLKLYIKLLNSFAIPYIAIYDKDHQADKDQNAINSANISSQKIIEQIDAAFGSSIIFENDIEEEIGIVDKQNKNKPFLALTEISKKDYKISDRLLSKIVKMYT